MSRKSDVSKRKPTLDAMLRELTETVKRIDNMHYLIGFKDSRRRDLVGEIREIIGRSQARTVFIDFDARRDPKTDVWCIACQKDLDPRTETREVRLILDASSSAPYALHAEDERLFELGILTIAGEDRGRVPIGSDCARKLGADWHMPKRKVKPEIDSNALLAAMEAEKKKNK